MSGTAETPIQKLDLPLAIKAAIMTYYQDNEDETLTGAAVTVALVDVLASILASAPPAQTIRGRRELVDDVTQALADQVKAYQALKGAPLIVPKLEEIN